MMADSSNFRLSVFNTVQTNNDEINSVDFSADGNYLVTSSVDDQIAIYNCMTGIKSKIYSSQKYGANIIKYVCSDNSLIHSSTKINNAIRRISIVDANYNRYFNGHTEQVLSLCLPTDQNWFISGSLDKTIRLWDIKSPNCRNVLDVFGSPLVDIHPDGKMFAVAVDSKMINLYDIRSFNRKSFITVKFPPEFSKWTDLKFSHDGCRMLITTHASRILMLNATDGKQLQTFTTPLINKGLSIEATFSPDSQFILSGSADGNIHVWNVVTGNEETIITNNHESPIHCMKFNPKYKMMVSTCKNINFWDYVYEHSPVGII